MATALIRGCVLTDAGLRDDIGVVIAGGRIVAVVSNEDARDTADDCIDLAGDYLLPGFIDSQVNGGGGVLFNDAPTVDGIRRIAAAHRQFGTTGLLPTLISDDADVMRTAMAAVAEAIHEGVPGVLGIHLEGPYLAPDRRGVHDASKFRDAVDEIDLVLTPTGGRTLVTLAPERADTESVRRLVAGGAIVSIGHTAADYAQTRRVLDAGARGFTHLFNAMTPLGSREPGVVGAALEDPESWCGVIVDGHHVHAGTLRVALAAKPRGKVFLVTDAMPPVGGGPATFRLGDMDVSCRDGRCTTSDGTLAGSALDMATAVRNCVMTLGVDFDQAVRMASTYPAAFLGIGDRRGHIAAGYAADLVALDANMHVRRTWIDGGE